METCFNLGYGGWCAISTPTPARPYEWSTGVGGILLNPIMFQVVSARISKSFNIPTMNSFFLPKSDFSSIAMSSIRLGRGVCSFQGEISFEFTNSTLSLLTNNKLNSYGEMFTQNSLFDMQFFDGKNTCTLKNCVWDNFSINCQPGALVTGSLSFQSNNGYRQDLNITHFDLMQQFTFDQEDLLIPYWQTGSPDMIQFQLQFMRTVIPVYLNNSFLTPSYLRPGLISINLSATYLDVQNNNIGNDLSIKIGKKTITFNSLVLQNHGYEMSNIQSQGEKTYQWNAISLSQTNPVFIITSKLFQ